MSPEDQARTPHPFVATRLARRYCAVCGKPQSDSLHAVTTTLKYDLPGLELAEVAPHPFVSTPLSKFCRTCDRLRHDPVHADAENVEQLIPWGQHTPTALLQQADARRKEAEEDGEDFVLALCWAKKGANGNWRYSEAWSTGPNEVLFFMTQSLRDKLKP